MAARDATGVGGARSTTTVADPPPRPVLIYDGDCAFCRAAVRRWRRRTGDRVAYQAAQALHGRFPEIPADDLRRAVQWVGTDGRVLSAAAAALRAWSMAPGQGWWWRCYRRVPAFAWLAERCYRLIADHRRLASALVGGTRC